MQTPVLIGERSGDEDTLGMEDRPPGVVDAYVDRAAASAPPGGGLP